MKQVKSLNEPFIHSFHPSIHSEIRSKTLIHPVIKQVMSLNDSFIHLICLKTMIRPVMKQVKSLNEPFIHSFHPSILPPIHPSIHSEICSKTLIHPVIKQVMSLNESLNHSRATHFSAYNLILPCQTWVK